MRERESGAADYRHLIGITDQGLIVLFEELLEALEEETVSKVQETASLNPQELVRNLRLSEEGAAFPCNKLKKEGRL